MKNDSMMKGMLLGAGVMYFLDPEKGRRRRALMRDQLDSLLHTAGDASGTVARDLGNRSRGILADARSRVMSGDAADSVVEARVRTELGRLVSHPGAVEVQVRDGAVTLGGAVLADEMDALLSGVSSVPGVRGVHENLMVRSAPGDVPSLQGQGRLPERRPDVLQENWAPATRFLVGSLGAALTARGLSAGGTLDRLAAIAGVGMLSRSLTNMEMGRMIGLKAGRRAVDVHKIVNVDAPLHEVFGFWRNYENFPRFMSHLKEVRMTGEGRSHWVASVRGLELSWDAETTLLEPDRTIAWKSVAGSTIANAGIIRFQENPNGTTRVDIRISYNPPGGALGHAAAALLGADVKRLMDDDLVRFQSLLENGKTSAHGRSVTREEIGVAT